MPDLLRSRLTIFAAVAALAAALPACGTDDALKNDAQDARQDLDRGAGNVDENAKEAADEAGDKVEQGVSDVDGR
jgi:hypothetical protein